MEAWKRELLAQFVTLLHVAVEGKAECETQECGVNQGYLEYERTGKCTFKLRLDKG